MLQAQVSRPVAVSGASKEAASAASPGKQAVAASGASKETTSAASPGKQAVAV